jgi:hypothetical protein
MLSLAGCGPADSSDSQSEDVGGSPGAEIGGAGGSVGHGGTTASSSGGMAGLGAVNGGSSGSAQGGSSGSARGGAPNGGSSGSSRGGAVNGGSSGSSSGGSLQGGSSSTVGGGNTSGGATSVPSGGTTNGGAPNGGSGATSNGGMSNGGTSYGGSSSDAQGGSADGGSGTAGTAGTGGGLTLPPDAQAFYFVSPSGSDDNPGTEAAPFLTVAKARDVVRTVNSDMTGDIYVYLRGGNYPIAAAVKFEVADSGTNDHRIYYLSYPGETPVLNGAVKVTGWTADDGGRYKATLERTTKLRNLYVNDARAVMANTKADSKGGSGTYSVTAGQASWAWTSGSGSDGVAYAASAIPAITSNKDDLEIVNGTLWNENIVCTRDVTTTPEGNRALLLQQPYGAIAQLPGWNSGFSVTGTHTIFNALEFLDSPGEFYFDKTTKTLYYYPRQGEDMSTADVEAPVAEQILDIAGTSNAARVKNLTFEGITFANTDYNLYKVGDSRGKASVQGATVYVAYGGSDWHSTTYRILDTFPAVITVNSAQAIDFVRNVVKHSGSEGISMINDVIDSNITGNLITDIAGSGVTIGHPQHVYLGDGGQNEKFAPGVEGICKNDKITDNLVYNVSSQPGFGGHSGITAFFPDSLSVTHNQIQSTAYNGISLGWGWRNFTDSTTCKDNDVSYNRFIDIMTRLHDSGAVYTIGQMPGTTINENYVRGIPPATSGPTYGLHNDEGTAYLTENDNVLDIDPNVKYTINCEDFGAKHDLTILRTYATVNKMGANPPSSTIDPPVVVSDNVWPVAQYTYAVNAGIEDAYRGVLPSGHMTTQDFVFPASCAAPGGTASITIRSSGDPANAVWFAPAGTNSFAEGANMTKAAGDATTIAAPATAGTYKLFVVDAGGQKLGESAAILRVSGG